MCVMQMQIAEKAADCVTRSITALGRQGNDTLVKLVLADEQVCGDLLGCLSGLKQRESQDPALRVEALTRVAAAVRLFRMRHGMVVCTNLHVVMYAEMSSNWVCLAKHVKEARIMAGAGNAPACTGLHRLAH